MCYGSGWWMRVVAGFASVNLLRAWRSRRVTTHDWDTCLDVVLSHGRHNTALWGGCDGHPAAAKRVDV